MCLEKKGGRHNCICALGYDVNVERNDSCVVTGPEVVLFISSGAELRFLLPYKKDEGTTVHGTVPVLTRRINVFDLYWSSTGHQITAYWIDTYHKNVQRMNLMTLDLKESRMRRSVLEEAETIVSFIDWHLNGGINFNCNLSFSINLQIHNLKEPKSLAVDSVNQRLYIIDASTNSIISTDLNGDQHVHIVDTGLHPIEIVLEPMSKIIIWSTLEDGIISASMDGTNKQALIQRGVEWPTGLAVDIPTQRLFWTDFRLGTIETALLNGKDRHIIKRFQIDGERHL